VPDNASTKNAVEKSATKDRRAMRLGMCDSSSLDSGGGTLRISKVLCSEGR
jgi:hypothetical protein